MCGAVYIYTHTSTTTTINIKQTNYRRYVDYPITDVLQMMGRAGRPQYDQHGVAVIMVHEPKKSFYKKFLYEPFPVESSLPGQLADHLNAEVVVGSIHSIQDALDYLTWTFFLRRLLQNPSYYDLHSTEPDEVSLYLSDLITSTLQTLQDAGCITVNNDDGGDGTVQLLTPGRIASFYYLQHATMKVFSEKLRSSMELSHVLDVLSSVAEYDQLPVRHNEDRINAVLAEQVRYPPPLHTVDDPHTKTSLLLQAHMSRLPLPMSDYITDTKTTLDQSLRILQAMIDVAADAGWLSTARMAMRLVQGLMQGTWPDDDGLCMLPNVDSIAAAALRKTLHLTPPPSAAPPTAASTTSHHTGGDTSTVITDIKPVLKMFATSRGKVMAALDQLGKGPAKEVVAVFDKLPLVELTCRVGGRDGNKASDDDVELEVEIVRKHGRSPQKAAPRYVQ